MIEFARAELLLAALLSILLLGCKVTNRPVSSPVSERSQRFVLNQLGKQRFDPEHFNARGKIKYDDGETRISFSSNIRMLQDSFIWLNASFLGVEVVRVLIRPDSVFVINRYEKSFVADSYHHFEGDYKVPVSFNQLQKLVLGNHLIIEQESVESTFISPEYHLIQEIFPYVISHTIDGRTFMPVKIEVDDQSSGYFLSSILDEYRSLKKANFFSYFRDYIIKKDNVQVASIQLRFSEIDIDSRKKTPFEIPQNYERIE